jgi:tRNA-2-methylthio-N6-dimethylallyladenosine synthase
MTAKTRSRSESPAAASPSDDESLVAGSAPDRGRRVYVETFGCQMNVNDSEKVIGLMGAQGYERVSSPAEADVVFINTCAVRERAAEKLFHSLGRLKKLKARRPEMVLGVGGCVPQLHGVSIRERAPQVDVLVGTHNLMRVPELVQRARAGFRDTVDLDRGANSFAVPPSAVAHTSPVRAYVTVMEGCNHVCSFCVVPRTRGPEVCRPAADVVAEVESLVPRGYCEVMLLGQTVNAYRDGDCDFAGLLARVDAVPRLARLRFTTSHPEHVSDRMVDAFATLERLCPYLHLPVQSGSDRILASMRRGYTADEYRRTVARLRGKRPDIALTTDVIVGYPGESEDDFRSTVDLVQEIGFDGLFTFMYSARPGTTALRLGDDVPEAEKRRRLHVLNEWQQRFQRERHAARVGTRQQVLVDAAADGRASGRSAHFQIVHFDGAEDLIGRIVEVEITAALPNSLVGRIGTSNSLTGTSAVPIL